MTDTGLGLPQRAWLLLGKIAGCGNPQAADLCQAKAGCGCLEELTAFALHERAGLLSENAALRAQVEEAEKSAALSGIMCDLAQLEVDDRNLKLVALRADRDRLAAELEAARTALRG